MENKKKPDFLARISTVLIILTTIIWGSSFVVMKNSVDVLPTFWLLAIRFSVSAVVLALIFIKRWKYLNRRCLIGGSVMGLFLFLAYVFQTFGVERTTAGKNAFLTAIYCVVVPFLYWAISRIRPDRYNILAAALCIVGIGLVSLNGDFSVNLGDVLTLIGGFFFSAHIVSVNRYAQEHDIFLLTVIQFASAAVFSWLSVLVTRPPIPEGAFTPGLITSLAYLSLLATCGAFLFQNIGQKYMPPATAAVLLCLEAPFGVIFSIIFAEERPNPAMFLGFALILAAVICSETKFSFLRKKTQAGKDLAKR